MTPTLTEEENIDFIKKYQIAKDEYFLTREQMKELIDLARKGYIIEDNCKEWENVTNA